MTQIHEIPLSEALDLHPHTTLDYMAEWFAHEASTLDEAPSADEEQLAKAIHCRAWAAYLAAGIKTLTKTPQTSANAPAQKLYCPHCLANSANLTRAGATIVVRDEHPEFTNDDVAQEMQCQNCATSFYVHEGETAIRPSCLSDLLMQLRSSNGTITATNGLLTFADGTSQNLDFIQ